MVSARTRSPVTARNLSWPVYSRIFHIISTGSKLKTLFLDFFIEAFLDDGLLDRFIVVLFDFFKASSKLMASSRLLTFIYCTLSKIISRYYIIRDY